MGMKHGKENHQMGKKEKAKDLRVIKTSCKGVFRAPELSSGQPSSRKRNQIQRDLEKATEVIRERKDLCWEEMALLPTNTSQGVLGK